MDKVGAFLCTGCEIGDCLDLEALTSAMTEGGAKQVTTHPCLCSPEGIAAIHKAVDDGEMDGVLLAACSPRAKVAEFTFDPTKVVVERTGLREYVTWTHAPNDEDTQMLAEDMARMGLAKLSKMLLTKRQEESIERTVLVVGGGFAGLNAAKAAAGMGFPVVVVDKSDTLGGYLTTVGGVVPEAPPYDALHENPIGALVEEVKSSKLVRILTGSTVAHIKGQPGQFEVEVKTPQGGDSFKVGAIVQATGSKPYDARKLDKLGYGKSPNVITTAELDAMLVKGALKRPSDGKMPKRVVFVQCAGSRDPEHLPYCSAECCVGTLRQVAAIRAAAPDVELAVVYRDIRAPGQLERFYLGVQEQSFAMFTRGVVSSVEVADSGQLTVEIRESLLGDEVSFAADLVVLAVGQVPNAADGEAIRQLIDAKGRIEKKESDKQVADATALAESLKHHEGTEILNLVYRQGPDLPMLRYGFPDSHYICFPYETRRTGIYAAGTMHAPMDTAQAGEDGWGAAMKAVQCIERCTQGEAVHPRAGDASIADFFLQRCTQCKRCTEECPFGTLNEDAKGTPQYNPLRCRRCGICLGACPERIISFPEYSPDGISTTIKAINVPEDWEEKPRILAFMCENDALPALDEAAARRVQLTPWLRIIPVRCLGAVNTVWIADSLSRGIDGVMLIGCKRGDDYQCHYIRGSELANTRMTNVKETLERLTLESERVRIVELGRDEFHRIPDEIAAFVEKMDEVGPNPYKGF